MKKLSRISTTRKSLCAFCGRMIRVLDPGNGCSPFFFKHKIAGGFCLGSNLAVAPEKKPEIEMGPPFDLKRDAFSAKNGGPSQ